ncbi:flagellar hook-associated protein FlgL [Clostridium sp. FAM 1755]|uniref:Flagellar hook-associated protein 3 n=1 Tax=Clostridium botulinum TaxID=1491 RepID=A0A6M0SZF5_CLOBO|nr:flagellar hook-associated protein FlgL [Clostridium sporogenes]NFA59952.1 flagellar hook-associated protein 3 [Clostridium botulinum]NFI73728.1 flagellar hook-associated protein 3 [Clostridium sporogenes]NFL72222.1 flagellar hook-associated protein 3 [Clostridium sporogenes]NFM23908.1 flagellar hook-associated protein 3 [Clostridium sporogenes]NFN86315.1 flagellar hook-associated protein 3 [Clostridium sporogenes]
MRITNKMMSDSFMTDMNSNLQNLDRIRQQLTTGKNFSKPSHDPAGVIRTMQLYTGIDANKQYNKNISNVINWLDVTDTALDQIGKQLGKIRDKLQEAGDPGFGPTERKALKDEVNGIIGSLSQTLNTNFDGKYIFSGTRVTGKPTSVSKDANGNSSIYYINNNGTTLTDKSSYEYKQINEKLKAEISEGVVMEYNVTAKEILEDGGDLAKLLENIVNHLDSDKSEDTNKLYGEDLGSIDKVLDNVLKIRAEVGAKQNRMDSAKKMNTETNFNMTEILSGIEDIDIVEKNMEYAVLQSVYISSLQTSAKVLQPTLMDYLR